MSVRRHPAVGPTGATGATGPTGIAPAGVPVLHGPYVVNFSDIPHDGDTMTLWTPQVGDVLLRLFTDWQTVVQWDQGRLFLGQGVDSADGDNIITFARAGQLGRTNASGLDTIFGGINGDGKDSAGAEWFSTAYIFASTAPVQIQWAAYGDPDPGAGHCALYALVARAVAP